MPEPIALPYVQPRARALVGGARREVGVYLPRSLREVVRTSSTPTDLLAGDGRIQWIDAFLAATPAAGVMALPAPPALVGQTESLRGEEALDAESEGRDSRAASLVAGSSAAGLSGAESAAQTLEQLAQRVRAGELPLTGYDPALGEPAALVSALAVLLGVRLAE